ncbi:hypothetical protein HK102_005048, partial [Quaeritorhiza haematococci]
LPAWLLITILPRSKLTRFAVQLAVFVNSSLYLGLMAGTILMTYVSGGTFADFGKWESILALFRSDFPPAGVLGAWIHYLAFDVVCGYYIAQDAAANNIPRLLVAPTIFMTLMLGPIGFLMYAFVRVIVGARTPWLQWVPAREAVKTKKEE